MNAQPEYKNCKHCGAIIRPGRNRRREYCNAACKQAAYNARLRAQARAVTVASDDNKTTVTAGRYAVARAIKDAGSK